LENNSDYKTSQAQQKIEDFALNMDAITKSEGLLNDPAMFAAFVTMRQRVKDLKSKLDEKDFTTLCGKLIIN